MAKKKQATKLCYVIMPFSSTATCKQGEWTTIFTGLLKPAVEDAGLGYKCVRSRATTGNIIKRIVQDLYGANVVIADLTDRKANVFYELGVRHTLRNRNILIAQNREDIPSDLDGYASHEYDWKTEAGQHEFRANIRDSLRHIEEEPDRPDNPVSDFLGDRAGAFLDFQRAENGRKLEALQAELYYTCRILGNIARAKDEVERIALATPAMDLLLATRYVYNSDLFHQLHRFRSIIAALNATAAKRGFAQRLGELCHIVERNLEVVASDFSAGNDVARSPIERFPGE